MQKKKRKIMKGASLWIKLIVIIRIFCDVCTILLVNAYFNHSPLPVISASSNHNLLILQML